MVAAIPVFLLQFTEELTERFGANPVLIIGKMAFSLGCQRAPGEQFVCARLFEVEPLLDVPEQPGFLIRLVFGT
jgi:hypothetical protein